ncbi:MAG: YbaK/EbsC family protein [Nitriliruptorales bacterium]|nr:YbaK/EbsC family protein [Nitriliruptorales bacterium]
MTLPRTPALVAIEGGEADYDVVEFGRVSSIEEASAAVGIPLPRFLKTMVVRREEGDYLLVLVPGDRNIDWPKLRAHVGVSRLSMPDAVEAKRVTGYERGMITPFGARGDLPVIADATVDTAEQVAIGGGAHGVEIVMRGRDLIAELDADVADVTALR